MIQEGKGRSNCEGLQPQGELGQLHGHGIDVHAKDAALHYHSLQDDGISELIGIKHYAPIGLLLQDHPSILFHLGIEGSIRVLMQKRDGPGGYLIGGRHQKMTASHCRVHDLQSQEIVDALHLKIWVAALQGAELFHVLAKERFSAPEMRLEPLFGKKSDNTVWGVVAAGPFPSQSPYGQVDLACRDEALGLGLQI